MTVVLKLASAMFESTRATNVTTTNLVKHQHFYWFICLSCARDQYIIINPLAICSLLSTTRDKEVAVNHSRKSFFHLRASTVTYPLPRRYLFAQHCKIWAILLTNLEACNYILKDHAILEFNEYLEEKLELRSQFIYLSIGDWNQESLSYTYSP